MLAAFSVTLFTSSALLFLVQPMIAKALLPLLGGSPAVWNTCMVFFQTLLLGGYLYAHVLSRYLRRSRQVLFHAALMILSLTSLPVALKHGLAPPVDSSPIPWLFGTLASVAGLPLFVISSTSPLLQRWFAATSNRDPYRLYAAGNAGSILALILYPVVFEPTFALRIQSRLWAMGYLLFIAMVLACAIFMRRAAGETETAEMAPTEMNGARPSRATCMKWVGLALVPSSLMLGVTTFLTTDIAAVPLLWVLPLGLYLLTFVIVFARRPLIDHRLAAKLLPVFAIPLVSLTVFDSRLPALLQMILHLSTFFLACLVCHGELVRSKPHAAHLTTFYLCLASGGVLGGIFTAIVAPVVFRSVVEYPLMLVAACLFRPSVRSMAARALSFEIAGPAVLGLITLAMMFFFGQAGLQKPTGVILAFVIPGLVCFSFRHRPVRFALGVGALILASTTFMSANERVIFRGRSFFSVHRITEDPRTHFRLFVHGGIIHGAQSLDPAHRDDPAAYFHRAGPIGQVFDTLKGRAANARIGVIGLGIGSLAAYSQPNQAWTFYEIDPAVAKVARDSSFFTFLTDARAPVRVELGDARLSLLNAPDRHYDVLILDAFSSDAIPVHLLTREAIALYVSKVQPNGILAFHISNRHVELKDLLGDLAGDRGLVCLAEDDLRVTAEQRASGKFGSRWMVMAHSQADLGPLVDDKRWHRVAPRVPPAIWTDDFSNLLSVFKWRP